MASTSRKRRSTPKTSKKSDKFSSKKPVHRVNSKRKAPKMTEIQAGEAILSWQRACKSKRCSLARLAAKIGKSVRTVERILTTGVRKWMRKEIDKDLFVQECKLRANEQEKTNARKIQTELDLRTISARTCRRLREPIRKKEKLVNETEKRTRQQEAAEISPGQFQALSRFSRDW